MLDSLRHQSHIVRFSAAKGIGRITSRLSKELSCEIVSNLLNMLDFRENDSAWHGSCLTLAELGRRGMILPEQLESVIEHVNEALFYDDCRGNYSVGNYVRDSACFVLWAFARAFEPFIIKPYVYTIGPSLIIMALFDREVQCRRAASAAFQEYVGRQGNFPHGIEILTTIDNIAVSQTRHTFLNLSLVIAQFDEYLEPMVQHLLQKKINHWDPEIRKLSAEALSKLSTLLTFEFIQETLYPKLILMALESNYNSKHGSIISLGYVVNSLSTKQILPKNFLQVFQKITNNVEVSIKKSRVKSDLIKQAMCTFISQLSTSFCDLSQDQNLLKTWYNMLTDCIYQIDANMREYGASAFSYLCSKYFTQKEVCDKLSQELMVKLKDQHEYVRCGAIRVLSLLPEKLISPQSCQTFITFFFNYLKNVPDEEKLWVNFKASTIDCATHFVSRIIIEKNLSSFFLIRKLIDYNLKIGIRDYTQSNRGDVAEIVRIASIN